VALMSWIVARTEPLREQTARRFLELGGFSVYIPVVRERDSRRIVRLRRLFPSYAFVAFQNGRWWDARWCVGVAGVIMKPARLSDHIVDEICGRERNGAVELPRRLGFKVGDQVRILAGPLRGLCGLFQDQRPHERCLVLLALLGAQQRVELARQDIEAVQS
jgi:transcription antitermination factor NusG